MHIISKVLIGLIALFHAYIMIFEMFMWESRGPKVFKSFPEDLFSQTTTLAANQGLYNGFLAAGLIWALLFVKDENWKRNIAAFFLLCVLIAGIFGGYTASKNIYFVQAIPAFLALISLYIFKPSK